jgi:hypothetical protein
MKDWLLENPNGLKGAFEEYFKALPADVKKVCGKFFSSLITLMLMPADI